MSDFGIKLAKPGVDINSAADQDLLFSSSWPNMKIYKNLFINTTQITTDGETLDFYNHGLGFVPFIIPFGGTSPFNSGGNSVVTGPVAEIARQNMFIDNQNIIFGFTGGTPNEVVTVNARASLFYHDIETPFTAPVVKNTSTSTSVTPDRNYGIKMSKPAKDITSTDMRDFIIHSSARSPMIHAIVPGVLDSNYTFSYTHDLPYNPIFFAYVQINASGSTIFTNRTYNIQNGYANLNATGNTITVSSGAANNKPGDKVSIVIFKDPFTVQDNIINVSL